ncbi:MAG TPA: polyketide cyclase [Rhodanobacteraceae bacterium]|nr:polyketide cyclase [Rhodanobacteraceae bacterium]
MARLLELIVAIILVAVLAVVVGVLMPSHGHVERSLTLSHDIQHTYDVLNNFRRFPDYSALHAYEPNTQFTLSGASYGVGSKVSWEGSDARVGDGSLEIAASDPATREIVWTLENPWKGHDKKFTIDISPSDNQKLVSINMAYDVDYGWNLVDRYSQLYLHGEPSMFMQYSLADLQTLLANVPNVSYNSLHPRLVDTPQQPVLMVSTEAPRTLADIAAATNTALEQIDAAMKRLGVKQTGPRVTITTDWGDQNYSFDIAVPIDSAVLTIDGKAIDLHNAPKALSLAEQNLANAAKPAEAASTDKDQAADVGGKFEVDGTLTIDPHVRAALMFGGRALAANIDNDTAALLPLVRQQLKAYAGTHGYAFNEYSNRFYDVLTSGEGANPSDPQSFVVYLPVGSAPEMTPYQIENPAPAASASAAASAASVAAPATAASASSN